MKLRNSFSIILVALIICHALYIYNRLWKRDYDHKVVVYISVNSLSYALATDFDFLRIKANGRNVMVYMGHLFGYFDHISRYKQYMKQLLHFDRKDFEILIYSIAESLLGEDLLFYIFPSCLGMESNPELMIGKLHIQAERQWIIDPLVSKSAFGF